MVCVNVLTLFYSYGRGYQLDRTLHWVHEVLLHRAYLNDTRYYTTPEDFLYFLGRLLQISNDAYLATYVKPLLIERIQERIGAEGDALTFPCLSALVHTLDCATISIFARPCPCNAKMEAGKSDGFMNTVLRYRYWKPRFYEPCGESHSRDAALLQSPSFPHSVSKQADTNA